jgi:hypothetical protein
MRWCGGSSYFHWGGFALYGLGFMALQERIDVDGGSGVSRPYESQEREKDRKKDGLEGDFSQEVK